MLHPIKRKIDVSKNNVSYINFIFDWMQHVYLFI